MNNKKNYRKTPWNQIPHEDKVAMAGGGRAGYESRQKHGYPNSR